MGERTFTLRHRSLGPTFRFKEDYSRERFFWFPRDLVKNGEWGEWPTSAQAVFPVLLYFMDAKGTCFPSMDTIGILCGRDRKTVSAGIEFLLTRAIPLKRSMRITEQGHKAFAYAYPVVTRLPGLFFPFRHGVIDGGNWMHLTPTAMALYVTMRTYSGVTGPDDLDVLFGDHSEETVLAEYATRDFELCRADRDVLAWRSGIKSYQAMETALKSLSACFLAERAEDMDYGETEAWKVYLTPPSYFKRDYLNAEIEKKFPLSKSLSKKLTKNLTKDANKFASINEDPKSP